MPRDRSKRMNAKRSNRRKEFMVVQPRRVLAGGAAGGATAYHDPITKLYADVDTILDQCKQNIKDSR